MVGAVGKVDEPGLLSSCPERSSHSLESEGGCRPTSERGSFTGVVQPRCLCTRCGRKAPGALLFAGYAQAQRWRQDKREPPLARPAPEQAIGTGLAGPLLRGSLKVFLDVGPSAAATPGVTARAVYEAREKLHRDGEHDGGILFRCDGGQGLQVPQLER